MKDVILKKAKTFSYKHPTLDRIGPVAYGDDPVKRSISDFYPNFDRNTSPNLTCHEIQEAMMANMQKVLMGSHSRFKRTAHNDYHPTKMKYPEARKGNN